MDPLFYQKRIATAADQVEGLGLFGQQSAESSNDQATRDAAPSGHPYREMRDSTPALADPVPVVPDIQSPAPSAPGSASSARAADAAHSFRKGQNFTVMQTLAALPIGAVLSREAISDRTGIRESSLCARLSELTPLWVDVVEDACKSSAGISVNGYRLTELGRARLRERGAA